MARGPLRRRLGLVSFLTAGLALAACGGPSSVAPSSSSDKPSGTLQFIVSSADASDSGFRAVNEAFMEKYPDVKVQFTAIPNDNWAATSASRLAAGNVDITLAGPQEVPSYVPQDSKGDDARAADAGVYLDLSEEPFMKRITPSVLEKTSYEGKQYVVPTGASYYTGAYYNKALFEKYHLSIPTTWSEFQTLCTTLKSKGVTPLGIGGKDTAGLTMLAAVQGLYPTAQDKADLSRDLWTQKAELTDSKEVQVLQRVSTMYGFAQKNFQGVPYSAIPSGFAKGEFAMVPDGTWSSPTIAAAVGNTFEFGYFPIPTSDNAADNALLGGKVELTMAVPAHAKNKTAALAYLDFFTDPQNYKKFVKLSGFASVEPDIPASDFLNSIATYTKTFSPAWDTVFVTNPNAGSKATYPFNYVDVAPLGRTTPEDAAAQSQKDWAAGQ
jgi:raffinose/stachyose/melibiose transport system substrate-binding protein